MKPISSHQWFIDLFKNVMKSVGFTKNVEYFLNNVHLKKNPLKKSITLTFINLYLGQG